MSKPLSDSLSTVAFLPIIGRGAVRSNGGYSKKELNACRRKLDNGLSLT